MIFSALFLLALFVLLCRALLRFHRDDTRIVHEKPQEISQTLYSVLKKRGRR